MTAGHPEALRIGKREDLVGIRVAILAADNFEPRELLADFLSGWGMEPEWIGTPVHALARLWTAQEAKQPFKILIFCPQGLEVTAEQFGALVKTEPLLADLRLIHIGSVEGQPHKDQLIGAGFTSLLKLPLNKPLVFAGIHEAIGQLHEGGDGVPRLIHRYSSRAPRLSPLVVLLAEADLSSARSISTVLEAAGHRVFSVERGEHALEALDTHHFDLAMVSLRLPGISGLETVRLFRYSRPKEDWCPFIALAERPTAEMLRTCNKAGIGIVLGKPIHSPSLLSTIEHLLLADEGTPADPAIQRAYQLATPWLEPQQTMAVPLLDQQALRELERLGGGSGFLPALIEEFLINVGKLLTTMPASHQVGAYHRWLELGHALKDSGGSLGALRLYELGLVGSNLSEREFHQQCPALLANIRLCFEQTRAAMREYMGQEGSLSLPEQP